MSQPLNQFEMHPPLGEIDHKEGEFWMSNPWSASGRNLSAFERNRVLLNVGERRFVEVSHLTTADIDSDSRSVVAGDFNGDGMQDLIVRNVGGGPLRVYENRCPQTGWLKVSLTGVESNSLGIGSKLKLYVDDKLISRELYPVNSHASQLASIVEFGLGNAQKVDRLIIQWPSGLVQKFENIEINKHIRVTEGSTDIEQIVPGQKKTAKLSAKTNDD